MPTRPAALSRAVRDVLRSFQGADYVGDVSIIDKLANSTTRASLARLVEANTGQEVLQPPEITSEQTVATNGTVSALRRRLPQWAIILVIALGFLMFLGPCIGAVYFFHGRSKRLRAQSDIQRNNV